MSLYFLWNFKRERINKYIIAIFIVLLNLLHYLIWRPLSKNWMTPIWMDVASVWLRIVAVDVVVVVAEIPVRPAHDPVPDLVVVLVPVLDVQVDHDLSHAVALNLVADVQSRSRQLNRVLAPVPDLSKCCWPLTKLDIYNIRYKNISVLFLNMQ